MFIRPASLPAEDCNAMFSRLPTYRVLSSQSRTCLVALLPYLQRPVPLGSSIFCRPVSLPTEASCIWVWQVNLPCIPTYRGLSRLGLACIFTLYPYLQRHVAPGSSMFICPASLPGEACHSGVWHVLFALHPYMERPVGLESGMFIHSASLPTEACHTRVRHV